MQIFELRDRMEDINVLIVQSADEDAVDTFGRIAAVPSLHLPPYPFPPIFELLPILRFSIIAPDEIAAEFPPFEGVRFCNSVDLAGGSGCDGMSVGSPARPGAEDDEPDGSWRWYCCICWWRMMMDDRRRMGYRRLWFFHFRNAGEGIRQEDTSLAAID